MKNFTVLAVIFAFACSSSFAQQKSKTHQLMVTIIETGSPQIMIITKEDGTQEKREIHMPGISLFHVTKSFMEHEDSVFHILQPFFDDNWKLVNTTSIVPSSSSDVIVRYFFTKQDD